jgi:hypothetical protein
VSAGISLLGFVVALVAIRVKRSDLDGVQMPGMPGASSEPVTPESIQDGERQREALQGAEPQAD